MSPCHTVCMSEVCITFSDTQLDNMWISLGRFCEENGIIISNTAINTVRYISISVWGVQDVIVKSV
jgi:hypothetical protein